MTEIIKDKQEELYLHFKKIKTKQINFVKNQQAVQNVKTGEVFNLNKCYESKERFQLKTIEQKINALISIAKEENLHAIFSTLTVPSIYHPWKTLKNKKTIYNQNYIFTSLDEAITNAHKTLRDIYRVYYKRVKNISKNIYYIKVLEPHKSLIPHMHILLFVEIDKLPQCKKIFFKVCNEYQLKRVEFDESLMTDNINNAVGYIMKYVLKTLNSKDEYFKNWLSGWRRKYKIRACEMSNLPISIEIYKKIYYNLPKDVKQSIQEIIESNNQSFFEYFIKNTEVHQIIYKEKDM